MTPYIGLPIWYNTLKKDYGINEIAGIVDNLKLKGISFYEVSIDYPWTYRDTDPLYQVLNIFSENNIHIGIHAPWRDLFYASPYEDLRRVSINILKEILTPILEKHYIEYIVIHISSMQKSILGNTYHDMVRASRRSIEEILDWLREYDTSLCIENLPKGFSSKPEDLLAIASDDVCIALDIAHLYATYLRNFSDSYSSFNDFLTDTISMIGSDRISTIHFHDVIVVGNKPFYHVVEHVLPGMGVLDYKSILKSLSKSMARYLLIEAFIDSKGKHLKLHQIVEGIREFLTWVKIYL